MNAEVKPNDTGRWIRLPEVRQRIGFGRSKIYQMISDGDFPPQIKLGRASVWKESDVVAWQRAKEGA